MYRSFDSMIINHTKIKDKRNEPKLNEGNGLNLSHELNWMSKLLIRDLCHERGFHSYELENEL